VELEQTQAEFAARGINVVAVTHDSVEIVKHFADRKGLTYPVLVNKVGMVSLAFGIENHNVPEDDADYGMPFPGAYIVDADGVVQAKYFEQDHVERYTAATLLVKHFQDEAGHAVSTTTTKHLKLTTSASEAELRPGNLVTLAVRVELGEKMHVYAPGVEGGYIPIRWSMTDTDGWASLETVYPPSKSMHLGAIGETVPVYEGAFTVQRDFLLGQNKNFKELVADGKIIVEGEFRYQACDEKMCYRPETVPLRWEFVSAQHDVERVPESLR
jgi:AhpC/TSA family protein/cytochrome c biogenesis DsbD-like protein